MLLSSHPFKKHMVLPEQLDTLAFPERIRMLAGLAAKEDPLCRIFGADKHQYQFAPPASPEEVQAMQQRLGVTFPEDYVTYLTRLGNGGAGPQYGLYSLEQLALWNEHLPDPVSRETWLDSRLTPGRWMQAVRKFNALAEEDADAVFHRMTHGALIIGTQGCTVDTLLLCSGEDAGKIVYIDWNFLEEKPPHFTGMYFAEWLEGYFRKVIAGDIIRCSHIHWSVKW